MAKRFTDTDKWKKNNFGELSMKMKLVQLYLWDNCDHAGVWDINMGLLKFQIGGEISLEEIRDSFKEKVQILDGDKLFMPGFIDFQYGELNPLNKVHKSVIDRLNKLNAKIKPLERSLEGSKDKEKDKEKDTVKDTDKEKDTEPQKIVHLQKLPISQNQLIDLFNRKCGGKGKIRLYPGFSLPPESLTDFINRMGEPSWRTIEAWEKFFDEVLESDLLLGKKMDFVASLPWLLKPLNFINTASGVHKGRVDDKKPSDAQAKESGAKSDAMFEKIIREGRYQFSKENYSELEMTAIRNCGGLAAIFDCTDFTKEKVKAQLRAAYKQATEELS